MGFPFAKFKSNLEQIKQASKTQVSKANRHFTNKAKRNSGTLWFLAAYFVLVTMVVYHKPHHKAIVVRMVKLAVRLIRGPSPRGYMPPLVIL